MNFTSLLDLIRLFGAKLPRALPLILQLLELLREPAEGQRMALQSAAPRALSATEQKAIQKATEQGVSKSVATEAANALAALKAAEKAKSKRK